MVGDSKGDLPKFGLQLGMEGEELTEQETALYDRQIRVWGLDAQRRLTRASILVSGVNGTTAEFCKNIVLAGVGTLTLVDDREFSEEALSANFLIPPEKSLCDGKTLAELCSDSLKDFNPMVHVSALKGDILSFKEDFFSKFDVVVVSCCNLSVKKLINEKCRSISKRVAFYSVDCRDSCGEIFVDLQSYKYTKKKKLDEAVECELHYPSLEQALAAPWKKLPKKMSKLYFAMRVIEQFEEIENRRPGGISFTDLPAVLKIKKELCEAQSIDEYQVPDDLLERLVSGQGEFPPVCAILGGILGQEVIKAVSSKGEPLKNFFFFDVFNGKGVIEDVSNGNASSNFPITPNLVQHFQLID
ncbi:hypothetical protein SAY86_020953 [Trapa natans]|uniref:Ubiquitin-like 1-activating enzyme E1A n=1 Tax=Trapa natans TaxID=22666 RepID=A0AAN7MT90_TRANT|nr:hypothetical protein SAY86_020953 [Trapa natans]